MLALSLIVLGVRLQLIYIHANPTPYWDDWGFGVRLSEYANGTLEPGWVFKMLNEHVLLFTKYTNFILIDLNSGQWDLYLAMIFNSFLWTAAGAWMMHIAIEARDRINPWVALLVIMFLWTFPLSLFNITSTIQTYLYYMILFVLVGCWWCTSQAFSVRWCLGIVLVGAAVATAGSGTFAPLAVAGVALFCAIFDRENRREHLITACVTSIISAFGLALLLGRGSTLAPLKDAGFDLSNFITTTSKTLSWPNSTHLWPAVFFLIPVLLLLYRKARNPIETGRFTNYLLMLAAFGVLQAISIGYARNRGIGAGPSERYFEFLAIFTMSSFLALLSLQQKALKVGPYYNKLMVLTWLLAFISGIPTLIAWLNHSHTFRVGLVDIQQSIVSTYAITEDDSVFENRAHLQIPFPKTAWLKGFIEDLSAQEFLPYQLQPALTELAPGDGPFTVNGLPDPVKDRYRKHENVLGSMHADQGKEKAVGEFISDIYPSNRPYVMIPYIGNPGYNGMSLKLVSVDGDESIIIEPHENDPAYDSWWREEIVRAPKGGYRIVAQDHSTEHWFGFGSPRSVGALTYHSQTLLKKGESIWRYGLLLLLISLLSVITGILEPRNKLK